MSSLLAAVACLFGAACGDGEEALTLALDPHFTEAERIRGVTLDAREVPGPEVLLHLRDMGVTHVTLVPFAWQERHDTPEMSYNPDARWYSESDAGIRNLARQADSLGMHIVLKPHVWISRADTGMLPKDIGFTSDSDWQRWEAQYRSFILHYARLSQEIGAPLFCIGTELARVALERPDFWRGLIREIRSVYQGKLTYAANWYEEYEHVAFWDALDYVGVQGYFPLSTARAPDLAELQEGWAPHLKQLSALARRVGRPVLFTEIGYRSVPSAAAEPWLWPSRNEVGEITPNPELQAMLYQAFFESVWRVPFFAGAIVWKWHPHDGESARRAIDFTPQGKPAERVIAAWFRAATSDHHSR